MVVANDGGCSIERLHFETKGSPLDVAGWRAVVAGSGHELPSSADVAFSGQRVVTDGRALSNEELNAQVLAGLFYDLRHVFRFPAIKSGAYWKDLGLEQFYDHGSIDRATVAKALSGKPVTTRWKDLTDNKGSLLKALADKGYEESSEEMRGTYRLDGDYVHIVYADGIYCHNVLGLDHDGSLVSMQVTGWGNNAVATLAGLSTLAARVFKDAILLDNGGDVFFLANQDSNRRVIPYDDTPEGPESGWVKSCERRYFIRSVIIFAVESPARQEDMVFVEVPNEGMHPSAQRPGGG